MRVIAGRLRGRRIDAPAGRLVRPTYDRVRESVFGSLGDRGDGARVLDLFAGSGALGIECLSRGAASVTFVERDREALAALRRNLEALGIAGLAVVAPCDALRFLGRGAGRARFDLVFVDPPYGSGLAGEALGRLGPWDGLAPGALVVVEHASGDRPDEGEGVFVHERTERYGSTEVSFFRGVGEGEREAL